MSSNPYALRAVLPRPISTSATVGQSCSRPSAAVVVRCLGRHLDVVRVALLEPRGGDAHERRLLELGDGARTAVEHRLPQATDELVRDRGKRAAERHLALDTLRDELVVGRDV